MNQQTGQLNRGILTFALVFMLFMAVFGYWILTISASPVQKAVSFAEVLSTVMLFVFWLLLFLLVFAVLLKDETLSFYRIVRKKLWARILYPSYLAVHLVIYGVVLERITLLSSGAPPINFGAQAFTVLDYYYSPHTILQSLIQMTQNPGIVMIFPPFYGISLGPFAIFSAMLIGMLVVVHTDRLSRLSGRLRRAGGSIVYPAIGIVGGATCCISLPDIAVSATPFAVAVFSTPLWSGLLYVLYYLLPISVIAVFAITIRLPGFHLKKG